MFPNANVYVAPAKSKTFGRPTHKGPVEAAIRAIRKGMRDFQMVYETPIFDY